MSKLLVALSVIVGSLMFVQRGDAVTFTQIGSSYDTKVIGCEPALFGGVCAVTFGFGQPVLLWIASTGRILAFHSGGWVPLTNSVYYICTEDHGCAFDPAIA